MNKIIIGIDPGEHTGIAILDQNKKFHLSTKTFWGAIEILNSYPAGTLKVYIEDPGQNKPVFDHFKIPVEFSRKVGDKLNYIGRIAQNIGENKRMAKLLIEYCIVRGIEYYAMKPTRKSGTKLDIRLFQKYTGFYGRCSEHARDAAMLIVGR